MLKIHLVTQNRCRDVAGRRFQLEALWFIRKPRLVRAGSRGHAEIRIAEFDSLPEAVLPLITCDHCGNYLICWPHWHGIALPVQMPAVDLHLLPHPRDPACLEATRLVLEDVLRRLAVGWVILSKGPEHCDGPSGGTPSKLIFK